MSQMVQHRVSLMQNPDSDSRQNDAILQPSNPLMETLKVAAFLAVTVGCRYYLTSDLHGSVEGATDASMEAPVPESEPLPNLMDLSTVSL